MLTADARGATEERWARVRSRLESELGEDVYSSWFARLELEAVEGDTVVLSTPTRFIRQWLISHYTPTLIAGWQVEMPQVRDVRLVVRSALRAPAPAPGEAAGNAAAAPSAAGAVPAPHLAPAARRQASAETMHRPAPVHVQGAVEPGLEGSPLDPRFTLDTFEEGRSNQLALAAARQVAFRQPGDTVAFNPLFIHAPVGFGKTHLLQAVTAATAANGAGRRARYLTAEHFMYRFVAALKAKATLSFKELLRDIDVLVIDDLQFLNGARVQEEFFHTLNTLLDGARQVVVAADRPPVELDTLDPRVRSRLGGGLTVEIGAPDLELRRKILKRRVAAQKAAFPQLVFPEEVVDFVAEAVTTNGRDLEGAVNRLVAHNQLAVSSSGGAGAAITVQMAEAVLKDLLRARETKRPKIEDIQRVVSQHFGVSKSDLVSARRTRSIVRPRQIAMFLSKQMTPRSLPEIGRRFGGRDHTTVLHAVRKVEELVQSDQQIAEDLKTLRRMLDD